MMTMNDDQPHRIPGSLPPDPPAYVPVEPDPVEAEMLAAMTPAP